MRVIIYLSAIDDGSICLMRRIRTEFSTARLDFFAILDNFLAHLKSIPRSDCVVVLYISDPNELSKILNSNYSPLETQTILVLSVTHKKAVSLGWKLNPRFICDDSGPFDDVISVLRFQSIKLSMSAIPRKATEVL